jgi:pyrroloquinoline quinone biosynthesis protein B
MLILLAAAFAMADPLLAQSDDASSPSARLRVIGSVQDGGLPHAACSCSRCEAARDDPERKRHVASLALITRVDDQPERVFLIDATPDIREQLDMLRDVRDDPAGRVDRAPIDGVLLTHAHIGHYTGLAFFGFEAIHAQGLPVWCTARMGAFLRENGPWSQLVEIGNIEINEIAPGEPWTVDGVELEAVLVPHRDEYSDTVGFICRGETRTVLYIPDTEPWRRWAVPLTEVIDEEGVDTLIVDATFYSPAELPGRLISAIGHPLMIDTMDLLQQRVDSGALEVLFTHLNHSNPALEPGSEARRQVGSRGFAVVEEGQEIVLSR